MICSNTALLAALALGAAGLLQAQIPAPAYKFDTASIKPGSSSADSVRINPGPNGGLRTENTTAMMLLTFAYDVRDFQIAGAPAWVSSDRFNIIATSSQQESGEREDIKRQRQRQGLQSLLLDRFKLVIKPETREMQMYSLVVGKGGLKMKPSKQSAPDIHRQPARITGRGVTLDMLSSTLSSVLQRPVANDSGLQGAYDFEIEWSPDSAMTEEGKADDPHSIFSAVREKLGLRLESKKGPGQVLVVVKIEKPSAN